MSPILHFSFTERSSMVIVTIGEFMNTLFLSILIIFSASASFADTPLESCMETASKYSVFRKDAKYRDCDKFVTSLDDCITVASKINIAKRDGYLFHGCLPRTTTIEECRSTADRMHFDKDSGLTACNERFQ
jgi:hypothetical protein